MALSLSSSAFVLQLLNERGEMATKFGSATLGILLMQVGKHRMIAPHAWRIQRPPPWSNCKLPSGRMPHPGAHVAGVWHQLALLQAQETGHDATSDGRPKC